MKTKFFKKLSLVLAVAMVLSVFSPAAGAFAASKVKLNSTKKYLHLDVDKLNKYNFNIMSEKGKGWNYYWESSKEEVAVVNEKNGVTTATGAGTAKISLTITDKDGEEVGNATATVVVRDNIKTVKISNPVDKLAVNEAKDFNRSFETVSGNTKKTSAITRWTVDPAEGATIDEKGVFVATEAGKYTVTAHSFQSKAKYNSWVDDAETYADYELATDSIEVVVSASIVDVKQVNKNKFTVEFDSSMADTDLSATTAMVYQVINGKLYNTGTEKIKSLDLDATGKFATVEIYGNLVSNTVYQFAYGDLKDEFTAASNELSDIAGIVFDDFQVKVGGEGVNMLEKVNAVNKDGVVILTGADITAYLTFEFGGDYAYGWTSGTNAYISKDGYAGKVSAKYNNFVYDEVTKTYKTVEYTDDAMAIGVQTVLANTTMQFAVAKSMPEDYKSDWKTSGFTVPAGDVYTYFIYTRYKRNTDNSWDDYQHDENASTFKYVTTNSDKLVITGNSLYPVSQGIVTVLVQDSDNNTVGAFDITITGSRAYASAEQDAYHVTLGNHAFTDDNDEESKRVTIVNKDTMGDAVVVTVDGGVPVAVNPPAGKTLPTVSASVPGEGAWDEGNVYLDVKADGADKGQYQYKVSLSALNSTKTINIFVNVLEGTTKADGSAYTKADVVRWAVEVDSTNVDLKEQEGEKDVKVNVYGYNANNARIYALDASEYDLNVYKGSSTTPIKFGYGNNAIQPSGKLIPVAEFTSGTALGYVDLSSYVVTAIAVGDDNPTNRPAGASIGATTFSVADSTELKAIRENASVSATESGTVASAVKKAFKFQVNGNDVDENTANFTYKVTRGGDFMNTNGGDTVVKGNNIHVVEVYYTTTWDEGDSYITYTFKVNQSITITE